MFDKRLADRWSLRLSYLLSRLYGNYSGLSQSDENGRTSPNVGRGYDYPIMMFTGDGTPSYGRLATDRPHQFKAQAIYQLPFGTSFGLNEYVASGVPVTSEAAVLPTSNYPVQYQRERGRRPDADVLADGHLRAARVQARDARDPAERDGAEPVQPADRHVEVHHAVAVAATV